MVLSLLTSKPDCLSVTTVCKYGIHGVEDEISENMLDGVM